MATSSAAAGYLSPSVSPVYDNALDDLLHDVVVGITGLPGDLVRPRWQPEPPQQPDFAVNWVAFGLRNSTVDPFAHEEEAADGASAAIQRDEILYYLHSFYGPGAHGLAERFRDGFEISQNRDALRSLGLGLVEVQEITKAPALLKEKWVPKVDVVVVYRRRTSRTYPILTITSATGSIATEIQATTTPIIVTNL